MRKIFVLIVAVLYATVTHVQADIFGKCCLAFPGSKCADGKSPNLFVCNGYECNLLGCGCVECRRMEAPTDYDPYASTEIIDDDVTEPKRRSLELPAYAKLLSQCVEDTIAKVGTNILTSFEDISTYFQCFDTNGNGLLTTDDPIYSEIMASGNDSLIADFKSLDNNGNGIDLYEFGANNNATYAEDASNHAFMHAAVLPLLVSASFVALSYV